MTVLVTFVLISVAYATGYFVGRLMRSRSEDAERCESCGRRTDAMQHDVEGIPFCAVCWEYELEEVV